MMAERHVDIAIIGAGVVGLATALALAPTGLQIALFDAQPKPSPRLQGAALNDWDRRVTALTPASIRLLQSLGAWPLIEESGRGGAYTDMFVWDSEGTGHVHFTAADLNIESLGTIVESSLTTNALINATEAATNLSITWDTRLDSMDIQEDGVRFTTSSGGVVIAQMAIGADGGRSKSRELASMRTREWRYGQSAIVATVRVEPHHSRACWQAFLPSGPLALLPLADNDMCSIVWSLDDALSDHWIQADQDVFVSGLNRALSGRGPQVIEVSERQTFPLIQCHAVDYSKGRFVLVGDAAHSIHPLAGQGINLGLSDAHILGGEVLRAYQRGADWFSPQVLSRYERQRKGDNLGMMATMQAFKWGFGSKNPAVTLMRNVGLNSVDALPMAKRWFMQQAVGAK
jgi:2-octaprenylphenol hydroxylase